MNPEEAIRILTAIYSLNVNGLTPIELSALNLSLIILIAFNNTLKEVSK